MKLSEYYSYSPLSKYKGLIGTTKIRAPTTYVGIEIELERVSVTNCPFNTWSATTDGSLKEQGKEFISIPIQVQYLEIELLRLFNGIEKYNISRRCSVHVHLNVRDFTKEELLKFLMLYTMFERSLYKFTGDRWKNIFCIPLQESTEVLIKTFKYLRQDLVPTVWHKYMGLNLCPIFGGDGSGKLGTVEFRHLAGSVSTSHILNWINLIISLKVSAKKFSLQEIEDAIENKVNLTLFAKKVFKDWNSLVITQPNFLKDIKDSTLFLRTICFTDKSKDNILIPIGEKICVE